MLLNIQNSDSKFLELYAYQRGFSFHIDKQYIILMVIVVLCIGIDTCRDLANEKNVLRKNLKEI